VAETLRSSAKVSAAVMASRVLGVLRDMIFARLFGANWLTDAYTIAFRIPNLLRDLFAEGALSGAFVPTFTETLAKDGRERAFRVANLVLTGALLATGIIALFGIAFAEEVAGLISGEFRGDQHALAVAARLSQIMMPTLVLISASAVFMGMLNAHRRYSTPAFAPALFNVTSILSGAGILAIGLESERAMVLWSVGTTLAAAVQAGCQLPSLWGLGFRPRVLVAGVLRDPAVRRILRLMAPASLGLAAMQLNVFVNTYFATQVGEAAVTHLQYAFRLFYLPVGVFGVALATVTTTRVAQEAARGDRQAIRERTAEGARGVWMLATASAVGLVVLAEPVVALLFERGGGEFGAEDTRATAPILQAYMLGVLPYSLVKVFAPAFYSLDRPRIPMIASLAAVAANLTFNYFTFRILGAPGLALGTTLAALVNIGILRLSFGRLIGPPRGARWLREIGSLVVANAGMGAAVWALWRGGAALLADDDGQLAGVAAASLLALTIAAGFVLYALLVRVLRYPGGAELLALPGRILRRLGPASPTRRG
jgi:putative peptidoglycan lipid II flippase